jgi:hypothetical protein
MPAVRKLSCRTALAGLAVWLGLGACGRTVTVGPGRTLTVAITEYRLDPGAARVPAGILTILVRNDGRLTHDLVIARDGHPEQSTGPVAPGQEATMLVFLLPGRYTMSSTILSDAVLGARGTLSVR